ncbi:TraX family protein [Hespellia stercorisuis]|uniref:TraX protein n=1 Tax=Hespellia stercorisuis DSM 15480 TaxID=1121950 RepID=A0A1M6RVJ4_9FIRM|nr:TraX family protein [Hespellia stercorisuis]SHK36480.1 TraX protein [Hespellia stercorisuis DSM 15480]
MEVTENTGSQLRDKIGLSGSTLKMIAIITMLIDHIGATIVLRILIQTQDPHMFLIYQILRKIGRISFPIFCFLLVEGFLHTHDVKKYALRLGIFAVISEIPFDLALTRDPSLYNEHQNVFLTLLIGLLVLAGLRYIECRLSMYSVAQMAAYLLCVSGGMALAYFLKTDYDYRGVICIVILYLSRNNRLLQCVLGALSFLWEIPASAAFVLIYLYNGKRGFQMKYFFYLFYPVHLLILYAVIRFMHL